MLVVALKIQKNEVVYCIEQKDRSSGHGAKKHLKTTEATTQLRASQVLYETKSFKY